MHRPGIDRRERVASGRIARQPQGSGEGRGKSAVARSSQNWPLSARFASARACDSAASRKIGRGVLTVAFATPQRPLFERGWRYTLVGLCCALANYAIMLIVTAKGGHYLVGTVFAFIIVTPVGYALHCRFTFAEPFRRKAFMRFVGGVASAYPISTGLLAFLCTGLSFSVAVAWPIVTAAIFAWNFTAAHWSIFQGIGLFGTRGQTGFVRNER